MNPRIRYALRWVGIDLAISFIISVIGFFLLTFILYRLEPDLLRELTGLHPESSAQLFSAVSLFFFRVTASGNLFAAIFFSALVTSLWVLVSVASAFLLRAIGGSANSILQLVRWYFPMKTRPIEACGAAAAIIVWVALVIFGLIFSVH